MNASHKNWIFSFPVGMIIAIIEFCHKSNLESKTGKVNFSDAMRNKAKLALQGGTDSSDVDAVRFYGDSSALWNNWWKISGVDAVRFYGDLSAL